MSACRPFHTSESKIFSGAFEVAEIPEKFLGKLIKRYSLRKKKYLNPQSGSFPDRCKLSWLEMGETERRQVTILGSEGRKAGYQNGQ